MGEVRIQLLQMNLELLDGDAINAYYTGLHEVILHEQRSMKLAVLTSAYIKITNELDKETISLLHINNNLQRKDYRTHGRPVILNGEYKQDSIELAVYWLYGKNTGRSALL